MSRFKRAVFNFKNYVFRSHAVSFYSKLLSAERLEPEALTLLNWQKRRSIVTFAFEHTRFYREFYEAKGIALDDLKKPETFSQLPILTKKEIRSRFGDLIADTARPAHYYRATTGGSTGEPLTVLHDRRPPLETAAWRMRRWWGIHPADDMAIIYRLRRRFPQNILNALMWWPTRRIFLDASRMTEDSMRAFLRQYEALRPAVLLGYTGAVYEFALFVRRNNLKITPPKAVWVTSAPLSEAQRAVMQTVFGAPVYDQYGTCEIMWLSAECRERNGLHINHDLRYIEFVDDDGNPVPDGEWGRILITDLENRVFPLIRYEIGDRGRRLTRVCPCGVTLPLMDKVRGRITDVVRLPTGTAISGEFLTAIFDDHPDAVEAFQIHQKSDFSITFKCVPGNDPNAKEIIEKVHRSLQKKVGDVVPVTLELVNQIPHDRGKTRFIISEVGR
jgi:phenylacetate-CoA ligase